LASLFRNKHADPPRHVLNRKRANALHFYEKPSRGRGKATVFRSKKAIILCALLPRNVGIYFLFQERRGRSSGGRGKKQENPTSLFRKNGGSLSCSQEGEKVRRREKPASGSSTSDLSAEKGGTSYRREEKR